MTLHQSEVRNGSLCPYSPVTQQPANNSYGLRTEVQLRQQVRQNIVVVARVKGDIVRAASGVTIEIVNTDAEGRLVLADALWYAQEKYKPRTIIDLATLTGAIGVALGSDHAGLFSNNDELSMQLATAGLATGEKLWRLPMGPAYDKIIESRFADIKNSGGRPAGSITAAQFLARFVGDVPWAHLDIAGVALGPPATETNTSWAPGFGVALLDRYVRDNLEEK